MKFTNQIIVYAAIVAATSLTTAPSFAAPESGHTVTRGDTVAEALEVQRFLLNQALPLVLEDSPADSRQEGYAEVRRPDDRSHSNADRASSLGQQWLPQLMIRVAYGLGITAEITALLDHYASGHSRMGG